MYTHTKKKKKQEKHAHKPKPQKKWTEVSGAQHGRDSHGFSYTGDIKE